MLPGFAATAELRSYAIVGDLSQRLPHHFQARANANYYTSVTTQQRYQQDLYQATSVHRVLQTLLGLPAPLYHHHRLILDAEGHKLSKSTNATLSMT